MNSARSKKGNPAMKRPQGVVDTTAKAFEDVRVPFLPRPSGDMKTGNLPRQSGSPGACPARLRRFSLHLARFDVTEFHEFNEFWP
jgi:hypothetical protein